jgi:glycosyltransferase involved in cell wall biosynthesis
LPQIVKATPSAGAPTSSDFTPLRILLLNHNVFESRGTYFRVKQVARHLVLAGHAATVVTTSPQHLVRLTSAAVDGVTVVQSPSLAPGRLRSGWDPWDAGRRIVYGLSQPAQSWDVIHAFDSRPTVILPALALRRVHKIPLVLEWADWWGRGGTIEERPLNPVAKTLVRPIETFFEEHFRARADYTVVISDALGERAASLGVERNRIVKLINGCDTSQSYFDDPVMCRRKLGFPVDGAIVGFVGTMLTSDVPNVVSVLRELRSVRPDTKLMLIGPSGVAIPDLPGLVRTGFVPSDLFSLHLGACDLFILPLADTIANRGRFPSKLNTYLTSGRPIVATPVGEAASMIETHGVGLVGAVEGGHFAAACLEMLADQDRRSNLGRKARRLALGDLSWQSLIKQFIELYRQARDGSQFMQQSRVQYHPPARP